MEFGVYCPNMHHGIGLDAFLGRPFPPGLAISRDTMAAVADLAEETGFDALWFGDHVIFPSYTGSSYPVVDKPNGTEIRVEPVFDPLAVMAWLGARTRRVRLGLSVLVVPYRNPVVTAKFFASLDVLTEGRIIIGAGVGVMEEEFEALDAPYKERGAVTDEYLRLMRELWTSDDPSFEGEHYTLKPGLRFLPKPVRGTIPIWIGGNTKLALRRTARLGDGWLAVYMKHDDIRDKWALLRDMAAAEGRDATELTLAHQMRFFINDEHYPDAPPGVGPVAKVVDDIARMAELGVHHLELAMPPGPTTEAILEQMHRFAEDVRPQLPASARSAAGTR
ncbi:MAG: LLM class F420-dependent oxidoreductase [Actinobacteria bacterium]|nr:MAG: LLM class F420-dependent oxidoreductase [Actinomycetota bacterium]